MLIVKLETEENGARANQLISPALDRAPEGWAVIPPGLEAKALALLPWMTLKLRDGAVTDVGDDDVARAAAEKLSAMDAGEADEGVGAGVGADEGADTDTIAENN